MTAFILAALLLVALAAFFIAWPLLRSESGAVPSRRVAIIAGLVLVVGSAGVYYALGSRGWAHAAIGEGTTIADLARHLESSPNDLAGWIELGNDYQLIRAYPLALRAYERANRLSHGTSAEALAGIGESMLMSGDNVQAAQASEFIERALLIDPKAPKALFYGALIAFGEGRLDVARARFAAMLTLTPPPPPTVAAALQKQIEEIDARLHPKVDVATAIHLHVTLAAALASRVPANASLFVFVRAPNGGPPLAVKRASVALPQDLDLSAADSMIAGRGVQPGQKVNVVARITSSGGPLAQPGDLYGEIETVAGKSGAHALQIDKLNP